MAENTRLETNAQELIDRFGKLLPAVQKGVQKGLHRALRDLEDNVRSRSEIIRNSNNSGLAGRLTSYARAVGAAGSFGSIEGAIGFRKTRGFPYELAQEFGAKAKPGGAMTIPVSAAAKRWSDSGGSARNFPQKLFIPPHMHVLVEGYKRKGMSGIKTVHYVLVKSIRARLGFMKIVIAGIPMIGDEVVKSAEEAKAKA